MDVFEIKKTRLNIVLKLFYPFITILGALVVYFGENTPNNLNYGSVVLLGLAAFLIVLLITMICYIFYELWCFKEEKSELPSATQIKANNTYNNVFKCFLNGGKVLIGYMIVFIALMMYSSKTFEYIKPSEIHLAITFFMCLLFHFLPVDLILVVSGLKIKFGTIPNVVCDEIGEKKFEYLIELGKLNQLQWSAWCVFFFNILYIIWF